MNLPFLFNRYIRNQRIVNGYRYQFKPFGGGEVNEDYYRKTLLSKADCLADVGANCGGWSIPASQFYREIHAFEANPSIAEVLAKNLRLNKINNVIIHPFALGEVMEKKQLWEYPANGQDSLLPEHCGLSTTGRSIMVETRTLDSFKLKPSVVKLDTEGFEFQVLKGGLRTIREYKPKLLVETHEEEDVGKITGLLPEYDWTLKERPPQPSALVQIIMMGKPAR